MIVVGRRGKILGPTPKSGKIRMSTSAVAELLTHVDDDVFNGFSSTAQSFSPQYV